MPYYLAESGEESDYFMGPLEENDDEPIPNYLLVRISVLENENKELKEKNKIIEFQLDSLEIFLKKSLVYSSIFGLVVGLIVSPIFLTSTNIK